ncbi:MAG: DUF1015 domain-containing protein [Bifidobacteriaceae bacterium]|jgi:uncharacterized protein (DUF1015 family)|nr:DUF1015 domain-containing protein [Bifidobacteriaceae bacterium]
MPRFDAFRALRYAPGTDLSKTCSPPYDVLSTDEAARLRASDPRNITILDVPEGQDPARYDRAGQALGRWRDEGVLVLDDAPSFTIYRMAFTDQTGAHRQIAGVLGALEVVDEGAGGVLPHERTTPKASTDRLDLTRATKTNMSAVWGLSLAAGLTDALAAAGEPVGELEAEGVVHTVERVTDPARIALISEIIGSDDVLIADGHHRYGVARQYRDEVRRATGRTDTDAELTMTFVGELTPSQLSIEAIHRLYSGVTLEQLRAKLAGSFDIAPAPAPTPGMLAEMVNSGRLVLLAPDGTAEWLAPKPGAFEGVRALDGAYLEHALAGLDATVSYQNGLQETVAAVSGTGSMLGTEAAAGGVTAGVLIRPTSIDEILRTAREGLLMPPKSTFFTPKPRTGLVVRPLAV